MGDLGALLLEREVEVATALSSSSNKLQTDENAGYDYQNIQSDFRFKKCCNNCIYHQTPSIARHWMICTSSEFLEQEPVIAASEESKLNMNAKSTV